MADDVLGDLIYARLASDPLLIAVLQDVGGPVRIYPLALPQDAKLPAMAYLTVGSTSERSMGLAAPELATPRVQVSIWHQSYHESKRVQLLVRKRLRGYSSPASAPPISAILIEGDNPDLYEDTINAYHASTDFAVWYLEQP